MIMILWQMKLKSLSPPTRAEWIEIQLPLKAYRLEDVSAHTGGVD